MSQEHDRASSKQRLVPKRVLSLVTKGIVVTVFLGIMGGGIAALHMRASAAIPPQPHPAISVKSMLVKREAGYSRTSHYVGRLEPARQTSLAFERAGLLSKISRDEGDVVRKGDIVAELDTALLKARRRQFEAQKRELTAQRDLAKATLGRQSRLNTQGWATNQRYDEARSNVARLEASIESVDAQIGSVAIELQKSKLIAPFDGTISARSIDEGAVVAAGTSVLTLLESGRRQARIGVPPESANALNPSQVYSLRANGHILSGRLVMTRPDLQSGTRTVTALFDVEAASNILFGEVVTLELQSDVHEPGQWVPLTALKEGRKGLWTVLTVDGNGDQQMVRGEAVEILHAEGQRVYVRGTLPRHSRIVVDGTNRVVDGQLVALAGGTVR